MPTCEVCWADFESELDLLRHEATEDDRTYDIDDGSGTLDEGGD